MYWTFSDHGCVPNSVINWLWFDQKQTHTNFLMHTLRSISNNLEINRKHYLLSSIVTVHCFFYIHSFFSVCLCEASIWHLFFVAISSRELFLYAFLIEWTLIFHCIPFRLKVFHQIFCTELNNWTQFHKFEKQSAQNCCQLHSFHLNDEPKTATYLMCSYEK